MSGPSPTSIQSRTTSRRSDRRPDRRTVRRRRGWAALVLLVGFAGGLGVAWYQVHQAMPAWYARMWYPIDYEDVIAREAERNGLDPALVAGVIYTDLGVMAAVATTCEDCEGKRFSPVGAGVQPGRPGHQ